MYTEMNIQMISDESGTFARSAVVSALLRTA
jgi:hypothetical protein